MMMRQLISWISILLWCFFAFHSALSLQSKRGFICKRSIPGTLHMCGCNKATHHRGIATTNALTAGFFLIIGLTVPSYSYGIDNNIPVSTVSHIGTCTTIVTTSSSTDSVQGKVTEFKPDLSMDALKGLLSGSLVRISKEVVLHPIETVKARVQVIPQLGNSTTAVAAPVPVNSYLPSSVFQRIRETYLNPNLYVGIYDGILPSLLGGIPAGAVFFGIKDGLKSYLKSMVPGISKEERTIITVVLANFPYWIIRNPSEVFKTRFQVRRNADSDPYDFETVDREKRWYGWKKEWRSVKDTWAKDGVAGTASLLYGSYFPNLAYALPADIIKFLAYEKLADALLGKESGSGTMGGAEAAFVGAIASLIAQLATTPLDVIRTRAMTQNMSGRTMTTDQNNKLSGLTSINSAASGIDTGEQPEQSEESAKKEIDWNDLLRGTTPRAIRALASGAVQFATYEITQNFFH